MIFISIMHILITSELYKLWWQLLKLQKSSIPTFYAYIYIIFHTIIIKFYNNRTLQEPNFQNFGLTLGTLKPLQGALSFDWLCTHKSQCPISHFKYLTSIKKHFTHKVCLTFHSSNSKCTHLKYFLKFTMTIFSI